MKVAAFQQDIIWNDRRANMERLSGLLESARGCELLVLPEMFSTGFVTGDEALNLSDGAQELSFMRSTASNLGCTVCGSVAMSVEGRRVNRFFVVYPDGSEAHYDKRHLFSYGGEGRHYSAGRQRILAKVGDAVVLPQICYDLRFPVFSRNSAAEPYDIAVYVASWPSARSYAWKTLLRARAIENQAFVIGVNRVGSDPSGLRYDGGTVLLSHDGTPLAEAEDGREQLIVAEFDLEALRVARAAFPVLRDAD